MNKYIIQNGFNDEMYREESVYSAKKYTNEEFQELIDRVCELMIKEKKISLENDNSIDENKKQQEIVFIEKFYHEFEPSDITAKLLQITDDFIKIEIVAYAQI